MPHFSLNTKNVVPLYIIIIFLALFSYSCNIYGQNNQNLIGQNSENLTDKDKIIKDLTESIRALQSKANESNKITQLPNQAYQP